MSYRTARRPQLERDTPLVAIAAARAVIEEASRHLGTPLPERFATRIAHQARRTYAHSTQFRQSLAAPGDRGRDQLYVFLRHWLAARLHEDRPALLARLPANFSNGVAAPVRARRISTSRLSNEARPLRQTIEGGPR